MREAVAAVLPSGRFGSFDELRDAHHRMLRLRGEQLLRLSARRSLLLSQLEELTEQKRKLEAKLDEVEGEIEALR